MNELAQSLIADIQSEATPSKTIQDLIDESLIPQGVEIPKPESIFELDNIPLFTKKSISTLKGKAKSGKTTCTAWVIAKVINMNLKAIWIDTEQGEYYGSRTQSWVLKIAGLFESPYLMYFDLREHNTNTRKEMVQAIIETLNPDIVIIDGIRDLVFDINNPEEATVTSGNLMAWATKHNCHILSILHENKGSDHARGHLGTEMINKSETVIKVSKDERGFTICEPEFTRGEPFMPFAFMRDSYGLPVMVDYKPQVSGGESNSARKLLPIDIDEKTHWECLGQAFGSSTELAYSELTVAVSAAFEMYGTDMGISKTKKFIAFYVQKSYLIKLEKTSNKTFYSLNKP
jgi:hypothetical protein